MKKNKFLKVLLWIIGILAALALILVVAAYSYFRFVFMPKLSDVDSDSSQNDTISFTEVAKEISDKQIIDNIINFDKQSAAEMLSAMTELEEEISETGKKSDLNDKDDKTKNPDTNTAIPSPAEGKTSYERIMNAASKDEISVGMSIISKVDMSKVNELRKQGKNSEIKAYLRSVLTSSEISTALKLYNKYKHLL